MEAVTAQPTHSELNGFIAKVRSFPVSAGQLQKTARQNGAPKRIIDFYKSFAPDRMFEDKDDLAGSSEQVELMHAEKNQMPQEEERGPEEY